MKRPLLMLAAFSLAVASLTFARAAHAQAPFGDAPAEEAIPETIVNTDPPRDEPLPPPTLARPKVSPPVGLRFDGGYSPRTLMSLPVVGADMGLAVGAQPSRHVAFWGATRLFLGSTENGLNISSFRFGGDIDAVIDRFRIGGGLHVFIVGVGRATRDNTIFSWGPAMFAAARFDLLQSEGFALFARAAVDAGFEIYNGSLFWGPTLGAGVDFDIGGKRASLR